MAQDAAGHFTYWSQRTFARNVNKGLRLDYFVCSKDLISSNDSDGVTEEIPSAVSRVKSAKFNDAKRRNISSTIRNEAQTGEIINCLRVYDCFDLPMDTKGLSDHCPVILILKKS